MRAKRKKGYFLALVLGLFFIDVIHCQTNDCIQVYDVNAANSRIVFKGDSTFHSIEGEVEDFSGEFCMLPNKANIKFSGDVFVKTSSLLTGNERLDKNMHEMFEIEKFPEAHCRFTPFVFDKSKPTHFEAYLTIRDKQSPIIGKIIASKSENNYVFKGQTVISLKAFNLKPPSFLFLKVRDQVTVNFEFQLSGPESKN